MHVLITYCLCVMDLFTLLPHFWENLDAKQKETVIRTHHARYFPRRLPSLSRDSLVSVEMPAV